MTKTERVLRRLLVSAKTVDIVTRAINIMLRNDIAARNAADRGRPAAGESHFYSTAKQNCPAQNDRRECNCFRGPARFHNSRSHSRRCVLPSIIFRLHGENAEMLSLRRTCDPHLSGSYIRTYVRTVRIELPDDGLDDRSSGRHVTSSNRHLRKIPRHLGSRDFRVRLLRGHNGPLDKLYVYTCRV